MPTPILQMPNSQCDGYPEKQQEKDNEHQANLSHINCLRYLTLKVLIIWFFKPLFAAQLGPEHKIEKCKSLVNIEPCEAYALGSFSAPRVTAWFFHTAAQSFARIGSINTFQAFSALMHTAFQMSLFSFPSHLSQQIRRLPTWFRYKPTNCQQFYV